MYVYIDNVEIKYRFFWVTLFKKKIIFLHFDEIILISKYFYNFVEQNEMFKQSILERIDIKIWIETYLLSYKRLLKLNQMKKEGNRVY